MNDEPLETSLPDQTAISDAGASVELPDVEPCPPPQASIKLVSKHPLAIRWMHWINFPILFIMIWSGLLIYWADSIPYMGHVGDVYQIGVGKHTLIRLFPEGFWNAIHGSFKLSNGLGYHFFFMWIFAINGLIYVLYMAISGEWRSFVPDRHSFREAWLVTLHDLHIRRGLPPQRKYNGAQKIAYTLVVLMGTGSLLTGLAIYKPTTLHWITTLLGGYEMARWLHFWLTMGFCLFFVIHVVQVALAGWNNFRAMVTGYEIVPREKAGEDRA
jgi:thiosulfate reductase cytochrome b subunit